MVQQKLHGSCHGTATVYGGSCKVDMVQSRAIWAVMVQQQRHWSCHGTAIKVGRLTWSNLGL